MGWEWVCRWFQFRVGVSGKVASFCCRFRFRSGPLAQCGGESWQWCAGVFLFRLMAAGLEFSIWWWRRVKLSLGALGELVAARYNLLVCGCHLSPLWYLVDWRML
ncbi:unnamed protein product [Brassica rapa subsp. narinosa]